MSDSQRVHLFEMVRYGEMTPAEAEAEAAQLNLEPFEYRPKPDAFDPMKETFWTLVMALAWIAYRNADKVREWWNPYRTECWDWHFRKWRIGFDGPVHEGHILEQRSTATVVRLELASIFDVATGGGATLKMSVKDAKQAALWVALREGLVEATGINIVTGAREAIPATAWHDLECHEEHERDMVATPLTGTGPGLRYEQVLVWRKAITGMWSDILPPPSALPETIRPIGAGYMPLYCAAQWIATEGGKQVVDPTDQSIWSMAFGDLLARLSSDQIKVIGVRKGERELVPGHHFAECPVDYPYSDAPMGLLLSEQLYLCSYPFVDEKHWTSGFDDSLRDRRGERWSRLMVLKEDVARYWPFSDESSETGAPGRPSSMYLVEAEFKARCVRGEVAPSMTKESQFLAAWLRKTHPEKPPLQPKSIRNKLASTFREQKSARN